MQDDMSPEERRQMRAQFQAQIDQRNSAGLEDFSGLSPGQMNQLLRFPLEAGSVVKFLEADPRVYEDIPLLLLVRELLLRLEVGEIKLTAKGNLPRKIVLELYELRLSKQYDIEEGITKLSKEENWDALVMTRIFADLLKWTQVSRGKLSLTKKGEAALSGSLQEMFEALFLTAFRKFDLGYFDQYPDCPEIQSFSGYILYLLLGDGKKWEPMEFYSTAYLLAWPMLVDKFQDKYSTPEKLLKHTLEVRIFERFLKLFGLVRFNAEHGFGAKKRSVMATDLFRHVFQLDMDAQRPERPGDADIQLKTALFDAEMGSESWADSDVPPEFLEQFHEQIRAFHAADPKDLVTIRSVMKGVKMKSITSIKTDTQLIEEIENVVQAYAERGLMPIPLEGADGFDHRAAYEYLTSKALLDFKVAKPNPRIPFPVLYEDVIGITYGPDPALGVTEAFLRSLLNVDEDFSPEILAEEIRLEGRTVSRLRGLHHVNKWRTAFEWIKPMSFTPDERHADAPFVFQFFRISYEVLEEGRDKSVTHQGEGVVQLIITADGLKVQGASFPGFEF